ncbi:hypothetical protein NKG94_20925 [Micromonospora sp. M12]
MTGRLTLNKGAVRAGPFKVTNGVTILPGQSGKVRIEVNQSLPAGVWDVQVLLASGLVERKAEGGSPCPSRRRWRSRSPRHRSGSPTRSASRRCWCWSCWSAGISPDDDGRVPRPVVGWADAD